MAEMELPASEPRAGDALYNYDPAATVEINKLKPWAKDPNYFRSVRVSAVALLKMAMHARSGGSIEVMGLMQGYVDGTALVVTDAFRLPVEGTETRVNAQDDANEYLVEYLRLCREEHGPGQRLENVIGWYHSHPGYGCWLSGIDVSTQHLQQQFNDPFVAVVVDPDRTVSAGKVEIGAFRTYPENYKGAPAGTTGTASGNHSTASRTGSDTVNSVGPDGFQNVPLAKAEDFGAHSSRYYSLEVEHFKSGLDSALLERLWNKYWVQTLAGNPLLTNRDFASKQMVDLAHRINDVGRGITRSGRVNQSLAAQRATDNQVDKVVRDTKQVATKELAGLLATEVKADIFGARRGHSCRGAE